MSRNRSIRNVAVILRLAGASGRDLLSGISRYAREHCHWRMTIFNGPDTTPETLVRDLGTGLYDGVITSESETDDAIATLAGLNLPLVFIGWHGNLDRMPSARVAFVRNDDEDIGRLGARYLRSLGKFRSFGFVRSDPRTYWSLLREKGFRAELARNDERMTPFKLSAAAHDPAGDRALSDWLKSLPQPAAVMVSYDELAVRVLDACRGAGIDVPRQMAVLGVDNDALLCDFATPPLSSVYPNHLREGETAAAELDLLMASRRRSARAPHHAVCREKTIVERASTATLAPAAHLVEDALRYIRQNADRALRVEDVVRHLHVSRRLADLRFREFDGGTIAGEIRKARLARVAERLRETNLPINKIASAGAFENLQHLANAFRRQYGASMSEYRLSHADAGSRTSSQPPRRRH